MARRIELRGWKAIPLVVLALAFVGYRATSARSALDGEAGERLRLHLQGVYGGQLLPELETAYAAGHAAEAGDAVDRIVALRDIELQTLGVKGTGDEVIAKVAIRVAGAPPPDGRGVRYFRLRFRKIGGWEVKREVSAISYYLKLF